ncbi:MAG: hypothetical protein H7839_23570 [Magnetococcus sp. YQC-5]
MSTPNNRSQGVASMTPLTEQEKSRLALLERVARQDKRLATIAKGADKVRRSMFAAMRPGDTVDVMGVQVKQADT